MAQIPKGRLVKGPSKPICRDCAIYFSSTVVVFSTLKLGDDFYHVDIFWLIHIFWNGVVQPPISAENFLRNVFPLESPCSWSLRRIFRSKNLGWEPRGFEQRMQKTNHNLKLVVSKIYSLRIQICPKKGISLIILLWGWDWDHQSHSREGSGFLGIVHKCQTI